MFFIAVPKTFSFWKKTQQAWFLQNKINNNNFFFKSKENDEFRSFILLILKNRKKTKKDLVKKKEPQIQANLKMTSKRKDQLKYQTSYILKARRQTKTFVFFLGKGPRIPLKQNSLESKIRSLHWVFFLQNKDTTFSSLLCQFLKSFTKSSMAGKSKKLKD